MLTHFWSNSETNVLAIQKQSSRGVLQKRCYQKFWDFTRKCMCQSFLLGKLKASRCPIKNRLWYRCFLMTFVKFLRVLFYRVPANGFFHQLNVCLCKLLVQQFWSYIQINFFSLSQALPGDFQHMFGKMHPWVLLGMRWFATCFVLFLKFYNFIKGIMHI